MEKNAKAEELLKLLPEGYKEACYTSGAIKRKRAIQEPESLMLLNLLHLGEKTSLAETSAIGKAMGIKLSNVGYMKRFGNSEAWFRWNIEHMQLKAIMEYKKPEKLEKYRVIAVDASDVKEKGATGRIWRLHYGIDLFSLTSALYEVTPGSIGESLCNYDLKNNDLVMGDRAYGTPTGFQYCYERGADFLLRIKNKGFSLYDEHGKKFLMSDCVRDLKTESYLDLQANVNCVDNQGKKVMQKVRICVMRKSEKAIAQSEKRMARKQSKQQVTFSQDTAFMNEFIVVCTSLSMDFSAEEILKLYQLRWQVELFFKRLKSILDFGDLPKRCPKQAKSWLNGKIMVALLLEKACAQALFSPCHNKNESLS